MPLPSAFPVDSIGVLIGHFSGRKTASKLDVAAAILDLLGFAAHQILDGAPIAVPVPEPTPYSQADLLDHLHVAQQQHAAFAADPAKTIPWGPLTQALLNYLINLLLTDVKK